MPAAVAASQVAVGRVGAAEAEEAAVLGTEAKGAVAKEVARAKEVVASASAVGAGLVALAAAARAVETVAAAPVVEAGSGSWCASCR